MKLSQIAIEKAAQVWCRPTTKKKIMDVDLAKAFAEALEEVITKKNSVLEAIKTVGHSDDCLFCGFKDRIVNNALIRHKYE